MAQRNVTTYKQGDKAFFRYLQNALDEDSRIWSATKDALILCFISISKDGTIDSVFTLNNMEKSIFSQAIISVVNKSRGNWKKGKKAYNLIIPFYFINSVIPKDGYVTIKFWDNFFPKNFKGLPLQGIFMGPIEFFGAKIR